MDVGERQIAQDHRRRGIVWTELRVGPVCSFPKDAGSRGITMLIEQYAAFAVEPVRIG